MPERKFKTYTLKDGTVRHYSVCNLCRSKREYPRQDKTMKKLEKFSSLDLLRALELRGHKVFFK